MNVLLLLIRRMFQGENNKIIENIPRATSQIFPILLLVIYKASQIWDIWKGKV